MYVYFYIMKTVLALLALLGAVACQKFGPKGPIVPFESNDCYTGDVRFVADKSNLCWYFECTQNDIGIFRLLPRRCALGSKMSSFYRTGKDNPCIINFNSQTDFDCTRTDDELVEDFKPACVDKLDCKNNGTAVYEGNICWCDCPEEWRGASDCSEPTEDSNVEKATGERDEKNCFYDNLPCDRFNGCENGGICHNLCKDFWCDCPVPFTRGKRCEKFDCETNPCKNGGTCNRGEDELDEVNECICPAGYTGNLCEYEQEVEFEVVNIETVSTDAPATSSNDTTTDQ